jgi:RNA polymerase sigma-70 factor, ECF subfamily
MTHEDASRLFYRHIWPQRAMVLRTAGFLARNDAAAEDLAQETLVKAFKSIAQFDTNSNAKAWVSAILRNAWIDHLRGAGRHGAVSLDDADIDVAEERLSETVADVSDPAALLEQFSDAQMIAALRTLPEEIRWTLMLVDVESLDHVQAAEILRIPEGTVKSRAHRGRKMMRERLTSGKAAGGDACVTEDRP